MISKTARTIRLLLPVTLLALLGCKSNESPAPIPPSVKDHAEISNEFTAKAEVTAIAPAERLLTLRREDGSLFDLEVGEAVRNFNQIAVGDILRVRYRETLAARKLPAGEAARPVEGAVTSTRAQPGEKPGGGLGLAVSVRVKIETIDREKGIVVFSHASGELVSHRIQTTEGRDFVQGLKVGDTVQLDYTEALALGIEEL